MFENQNIFAEGGMDGQILMGLRGIDNHVSKPDDELLYRISGDAIISFRCRLHLQIPFVKILRRQAELLSARATNFITLQKMNTLNKNL